MQETIVDLLSDLEIEINVEKIQALQILAEGQHKYIRDLRMNAKSVLQSEHLNNKETALLALAIAANNNNELLVEAYKKKATTEGASNEELAESIAIASLLTINNVIYRFRHFVKKDEYQNQNAPARLRMNIMMNPVLGKEFFELISLAVSTVNGCEQCVVAHENSVLEAGATEKRIWDAIRIAAVITSLGKVIR